MKKIRTSELRPGMVVYEDIYSFSNQLILPRGSILTDKSITSLEFYSILSVRVQTDDDDEQAQLDAFASLPDTMTYSEKIRSTNVFKEFKSSFLKNSEVLEGSLKDIVENNAPIDTSNLLHSVTDIISAGTTSLRVFDMLHNMRNYDDLTYVHSMSVSLICNIFGKWLGFDEKNVQILTLAGLLHDIGKLSIDDKIIKKPSKLTDAEYNLIKTHTLQGYNILKNQPIDDRIKEAALLHHERCDGLGYPLGYTSNRIPDFAKIVAIADVYDAMTATRVYRGPMCPFKVLSIFESEGYLRYDPRFLLPFLENISSTYINNRVRLSDGREGDIVMINKNFPSRPIINVDNNAVNLLENKELYIDELL